MVTGRYIWSQAANTYGYRLHLRSKSSKNVAAKFGECGSLTFTVSFE